jgi:hypothetical protein
VVVVKGRVAIRRALTAATLSFAVLACRPGLDERTSIVSSPRILAVRAEPAEAAPRANVTLTALWADPAEGAAAAPIDWAFCEARKPLSELGPVASACLARGGDAFVPLGTGATVSAAVPEKACKNFGPEVPDATKDAPAGRPVDPDETGGYYQPVTLAAPGPSGDAFTVGNVRLTCGVVGASPEQLAQIAAQSHVNQNPSLDAVTADGAALDEHGTFATPAGAKIHLRASWADCAVGAAGCGGAEHFAVYDVGTRAVVARREAVRVAWYASGGELDVQANGRDELDGATFVENDWTAPTTTGSVTLWLVVRDARGGVGWRRYAVDVR